MLKFKIRFPSGYHVDDPTNDNIDINVFLPNGDVLFATLFTTKNIDKLIVNNDLAGFWATDMIVIKQLTKSAIKLLIEHLLENDYTEAFSKIGNWNEPRYKYASFDDIEDMTNLNSV